MKRLKRIFGIGILTLVLAMTSIVYPCGITQPVKVEAASAVKLNKTKLVMDKDAVYQLKVSGTQKKVKWKSSKTSVASVSSTGKVKAKKAGKSTITATVGKKAYQCKVTVETPKISKKSASVYVNQTITLKVNNTSRKVTWSSKEKSIATVSSKGVVKGKKAGTTTITAKVGSKKYTCKVTVKKKSGTAEKQKAEVLKIMNAERKKAGLSALKMDNATLDAAADIRAKEIVKSFSHTRPNGESCFSIIKEGKYKVEYYMAGENIAAGYANAEAVMDGWMNSPGHRANILNGEFDTVGIGYYYNESQPYRYYWVQLFVKSR
ncbi:MAG: CAP domain-containing protein [Lachnospiraceae bacterium]